MIVFISILSFILDGIVSKYVNYNSLFIPLLTIMSIIIIYPYFQTSYRYLRYCAILGLLYDIAYMNTIFYSSFVFILIAIVTSFFYYMFSNTLRITIVISLSIICLYRIVNLLFLFIFKGTNINFDIFIRSIYSSIILNVSFCIIGYVLSKIYSKKHNILRIN